MEKQEKLHNNASLNRNMDENILLKENMKG